MCYFLKKKPVLIAVIYAAVCCGIFAAGARDSEPQKAVGTEKEIKPHVIRAAVLNGPSGIGLSYLFEFKPAAFGCDVQMEVDASPDVMLPKLLKGELDIGILPPNAAAKVYNTTGAVVMGAVVGNGMLHLLAKNSDVPSLAALRGKTVYTAGQGATPEYVFRYLLAKSGIAENGGADGVSIDFSLPPAEIAAALAAGKISYALLPEPFATVAQMKSSDVKRALDIQKVFAELSGSEEDTAEYPMTLVVVRKEFAERYAQTVRLFLQSCAQSVALTNGNPSEAALLAEKHSLGLKAAVAEKSIPNAAFVYKDAGAARADVEKLLSVFLDFAPESIGGKLPDDAFYFK
ncbi:MAG: ABC transporter substrate-binding protein [Bacteroides sp.]|nr:ABC transporter substrate-binding protein [Prevotella sp.]MCM1408234.1 ABC transporter substrate-binding protein [Treponema brennaborense]MCM1469558.1 ABC transporter substrate-binding protein [Bacteroides sp.]